MGCTSAWSTMLSAASRRISLMTLQSKYMCLLAVFMFVFMSFCMSIDGVCRYLRQPWAMAIYHDRFKHMVRDITSATKDSPVWPCVMTPITFSSCVVQNVDLSKVEGLAVQLSALTLAVWSCWGFVFESSHEIADNHQRRRRSG